MQQFRLLLMLFFLLAWISGGFGQSDASINGKWQLIADKSSEISLFENLTLDIQQAGSRVSIVQVWGRGKRTFKDSLSLVTGGKINKVPIRDRVWPTNVFMGISMKVGANREIAATWQNNGTLLRLQINYPVLASQGTVMLSSVQTYELSKDKEILTYSVTRDTRVDTSDFQYILKRAGTKEAFVMYPEDNWEIDGKLPENAFLISLQGVANMNGPLVYFVYPKTWSFNYTPAVFDFYKDKKYYTFTELQTPKDAIQKLKQYVKGYVVWDKEVRTSLIVAFTVAGLEQAVVVSEDMIPLMEDAGLPMVEDLRTKFRGKSDAEIYQWAYDQYWPRCNKELIIWLGGEGGNVMKPGVADWGIYNKVFFNDLSSRPSDKEEYALADKILGEMKPMSLVMGWHSYAKDLEREHVTLISHHGFRVEGLHTLPNMSFSHQVPASPGFKYKNNHHIEPGKKYVPEDKVYVTCIQTDGLGIGAWLKPGRGQIPYAWEVIMNYSWLAPAMMEFFYSTATPNDYFIGALSGPGYMYPKAVPLNLLPGLIKEANRLMGILDLQVFETMDYSQGATIEGNTELTKSVVEAYYKNMPNAIGFVNGYAPAFTFAVQDNKPFISYDYYLSPTREEGQAVADLHELAAINKKRPYFLLMHVRESSDVQRVKDILDKLGPEFEVVPLDIFLKMAGQDPTFKERFLEK